MFFNHKTKAISWLIHISICRRLVDGKAIRQTIDLGITLSQIVPFEKENIHQIYSHRILHCLDKIFLHKLPWNRSMLEDQHQRRETSRQECCTQYLDFSAERTWIPLEMRTQRSLHSVRLLGFSFIYFQHLRRVETLRDRKIPRQISSHIHEM